MENSTCPSCRKNILAKLVPTKLERDIRHSHNWESFQAALQPARIDPVVVSIQELELAHSDFRRTSISQMSQNREKDLESANRIRSEILPFFDTKLSTPVTEARAIGRHRLNDTTGNQNFLQERRDCWQLLAEALEQNDPLRLALHTQAWNRFELASIAVQDMRRKRSTKDPKELTEEFTRALVTFTPKLISTPTIIVLNVLVFASMAASGVNFLAPDPEEVLRWGANFGPQTMNGEWWRLFSSMFLHFGVIHLAMNMWILWDFGRLVERLVGNSGFVVLYLVSGLAGSLSSLAWNPTVISAGASGAVFGVSGALLGLTVFRRDSIPKAVLNHLRNSLGIFLAYNIFYGLKATGIDHAAHAGGFAAGLLCGLIQNQPLSTKMLRHRIRRNLLTAAIGALALITTVAVLPAAPLNSANELQRFIRVEDHALRSFERLVEDEAEGRISAGECADAIDTKILPPWGEVKNRIKQLSMMPYVNRSFFSKLSDYMGEREKSWLMYSEAIREQDDILMERANRKWKSVNDFVEQALENAKGH